MLSIHYLWVVLEGLAPLYFGLLLVGLTAIYLLPRDCSLPPVVTRAKKGGAVSPRPSQKKTNPTKQKMPDDAPKPGQVALPRTVPPDTPSVPTIPLPQAVTTALASNSPNGAVIPVPSKRTTFGGISPIPPSDDPSTTTDSSRSEEHTTGLYDVSPDSPPVPHLPLIMARAVGPPGLWAVGPPWPCGSALCYALD